MGCDTFDSASYMLYARQNRYITEDGTRHLPDMTYFACPCKVCTKYTPKELHTLDITERTNNIALHNLYSIKAEVDRVKEAITEGRLWEYVIKKCRAHPRLYEIIDVFIENSDHMRKTTPLFKQRAAFFYSATDQFRPEVTAYGEVVKRFKTKKRSILIMQETSQRPTYLSPEYGRLQRAIPSIEKIQVCQYSPFLGPIPIEISDLYPAAHHVAARTQYNPKEFPMFGQIWTKFFENNKFEEITYDKNDKFLSYFVKRIPGEIKKRSLKI